jgi:hypothetical protein
LAQRSVEDLDPDGPQRPATREFQPVEDPEASASRPLQSGSERKNLDSAWQLYRDLTEPTHDGGDEGFMGGTTMRRDGGLDEIRKRQSQYRQKLYGTGVFKYWRFQLMVIKVLFAMLNVSLLLTHNIINLTDTDREFEQLRWTIDATDPVTGMTVRDGTRSLSWLVSAYEVTFISYSVMIAIYEGMRAAEFDRVAGTVPKESLLHKQYSFHCWQSIYNLLHCHLPNLGRFSALQSLYYAHPAFIQGHIETYAKAATETLMDEDTGTVLTYLLYGLFSLIAGIMGVFAFVWKFLEMSYMYMRERNRIFVGLSVLNYLNQTLNIIDVGAARQDRLFLFMFGGADAQMQNDEMERKEAYLTRVMEVIYDSIGCGHCLTDDGKSGYDDEENMMLAYSAMVTFDHLDVQRLVVQEWKPPKPDERRERQERQKQSLLISFR